MGIGDADPDLFDAAEFGDLDWVERSIGSLGLNGKPVNINAQDNGGKTILMIATRYNHIDVVRFLLEKGADPNIRDKRGHTALIEAQAGGHKELIELLTD
ncbi:ankyrin repeat domain-containing protein [Candidatus Leptofilum sp.]|uniref:ankyrin repeat domain-containing protein n=1 Tax=Candidatus Leptofilum sp. TaxID=3241576 RepID=UPI003B5C70D6